MMLGFQYVRNRNNRAGIIFQMFGKIQRVRNFIVHCYYIGISLILNRSKRIINS